MVVVAAISAVSSHHSRLLHRLLMGTVGGRGRGGGQARRLKASALALQAVQARSISIRASSCTGRKHQHPVFKLYRQASAPELQAVHKQCLSDVALSMAWKGVLMQCVDQFNHIIHAPGGLPLPTALRGSAPGTFSVLTFKLSERQQKDTYEGAKYPASLGALKGSWMQVNTQEGV